MKRIIYLCALISFNSNSAEVITSIEQASSLVESGRVFNNKSEDMIILENEANSLGVMIGQYQAAKKINEFYENNETLIGLDKFGSFELLGIAKKYKGVWLVNPSIIQYEEQYLISPDKKSFRVKDKSFGIDQDPYFTKVKPSWRDYLIQNIELPSISDAAVLPRNKEEQAVWDTALKAGFDYGFEAQQESAYYQIVQFTKMIVGMNYFDILKDRQVVSDFVINDDYYPVSGGGFELDINQSSVRITVNPILESYAWDWKEIPELRDISDLLPMKLNSKDWVQ